MMTTGKEKGPGGQPGPAHKRRNGLQNSQPHCNTTAPTAQYPITDSAPTDDAAFLEWWPAWLADYARRNDLPQAVIE